MQENNTLKEYYINLNKLYTNAINLLTAINQSFYSNASEINVTYTDSDDYTQSIRIPSFLYLENKIEQLDSNFSNLFNMPKSGEAWFHNYDDMYKLEFVNANNAPIKPQVNKDKLLAYVKDTNIFKDLVNPKTYLKVDISNLPNNIEKMLVKKMVFFDPTIYDRLKNSNLTSYDEYQSTLYNLTKGIDYEEYDSVIDLPIKENDYVSNFNILTVDDSYENTESLNRIYKVNVNTITYTKENDSSIEFTLQKNQYLCLDNEYVVYKIIDINITQLSNEITLEEVIGHMSLQTFEENQNMVLHLYNQNFDKFHYIELPLEENQYVVFFLSTLYNNVKSVYSEPILLNLAEINMVDKDGNKIINNGKEISYLEYYNKYCQNIGDMLLGFSNVAYSQISNYSVNELSELQNSDTIQKYVSNTIKLDDLKVQRINTHLIDDEFTTQIINLHSKRNELTTSIENIQSNIDTIYNQLVNTDFESDNSTSQLSLKSKLNDLYSEKTILQKQLISVIDNINILKTNVYGTSQAKYRIRGNTNIDDIEDYLLSAYYKCNIIQMEVQYKYKTIGNTTTNVSNINSNLFTDWNKLNTIERERKIVFDNALNTYHLEYETYNDLTNIIKWNQIEIPITNGEDVILRVRYKYSIGQPFINLYTPWSDEYTINFPQEYSNTTELSTIIDINNDDITDARFLKTLINEGYSDHINNKIIDNSQVFYHMPENIYSGFNTPENSFITLKDKLQSMCNDIDVYKNIIQSDIESNYSVYLKLDNQMFELFANKNNNITVSSSDNTDTFVTKNLELIIKNTGVTPLKLYSLFPGNSDKYLINMDNTSERIYNSEVYENVPLLIEGESYLGQSAYDTVSYQSLGQFIYFSKKSSFGIDSYYVDDNNRKINLLNILYNAYDNELKKIELSNINSSPTLFTYSLDNYINSNNKLMDLMPRYRLKEEIINTINIGIGTITYNQDSKTYLINNVINNEKIEDTSNISSSINETLNTFDFIDYIKKNKDELQKNNFIFRYEHIYAKYNGENIQLTNEYPLNTILKYDFHISNSNTNLKKENLVGAFFIPTLINQNQILCNQENNTYLQLNVGESISIPLLFQYYLNDKIGDQITEITKTLSFDIKKSLFKSPENFTISVTAKINNTIDYLNSQDMNTLIDNISFN